MNKQNAERIKHIFNEALELPPGARGAFLSGVCGEDAALRHEVEALLSAHREAGEFLADAAPSDREP